MQPPRRPWWTVAASFGGQALLIVLLAWIGIPVLAPQLRPARESLLRFDLVAPPVMHPPRPHVHLTLPPPREVARLERTPAPVPVPERPRVVPQPTPPKPEIKPAPTPQPVSKPAAAEPVRPAPAPVKMGVFNASQTKATVNRPAREVQTGGFGSPAGVASHAFGPANVPRLGGFDMPEGAGRGNGRAGARGTPGVVASAGFGNGMTTGTPGRPHGAVTGVSFGDGIGTGSGTRSGHGAVQSSGFDAQAQAASARHPEPAAETVTPLEVLYKPRPAYTQEARNLHLEGTVLLSAAFPAHGPVHVIRVIRGLGHGLDESAIRAAEQIRFKPKQRNGQPVDTTATLAIVFQLAY